MLTTKGWEIDWKRLIFLIKDGLHESRLKNQNAFVARMANCVTNFILESVFVCDHLWLRSNQRNPKKIANLAAFQSKQTNPPTNGSKDVMIHSKKTKAHARALKNRWIQK